MDDDPDAGATRNRAGGGTGGTPPSLPATGLYRSSAPGHGG